MALAVASTSVATTNSGTSLVITKPSGVAVGDVLVVVVNASVLTVPTISGFTQGVTANNTSSNNARVTTTLLWRIATSGDVAASNYTISGGSSSLGAATMLRVTGWTQGNPIFSTVANQSGTATRRSQQLLIMGVSCNKTTSTNITVGSYSVTSSDSNPTWVEVQDQNYDTGILVYVSSVAYALSSNTSDITNYGFGFSDARVNPPASFLIVINSPINVTPNVSHLDTLATAIGLNGANSATADVQHLAIVPTINGVSSRANNPIWTPEVKTATTWTPEIK